MTLFHRLLLLAAMLGGCDDGVDTRTPVERFGLLETSRDRPLAAAAVTAANAIVGDEQLRLRASWQEASVRAKPDSIPVYLIDSASIAVAYMVAVPPDCRCIFIQPDTFARWIQALTKRRPEMLDADPVQVLTFMLLHEVGHIAIGHPGQFDGREKPNDRNIEATAEKDRETDADRFAVERVKAAIADTNADGWSAANWVAIALANLSWNMTAGRLLDNFGATSVCARAAFADAGYSHPNFELRLLLANDALSGTATSRELLDTFMTCRLTPAPRILFRKAN